MMNIVYCAKTFSNSILEIQPRPLKALSCLSLQFMFDVVVSRYFYLLSMIVTSTFTASKGYTSSTPTSIDEHNSALDHCKLAPSRTKKLSATFGMVNLIRKATGRKLPAAVHETPLAKDTRRSDNVVNDLPKRSALVPRLSHRKLAELPFIVTDTSRTLPESSHQSNARFDKACPLPVSPSGFARRIVPSSSSMRETIATTMFDVFDDDNLTSAKDIRATITTSEDEVRKLVDAFNELEASALRRFQTQHARRLPVTTPDVNVLLEGREWREHRLIPAPSPVLDFQEPYILNSADSTGDGFSICSGSSNQTSISQARSISSLRKNPPGSLLSPHFRTPPLFPARKNSISSISSRRVSFNSTRMLAVTSSSTLPRNGSHLALPKRKGKNSSKERIGVEGGDDESEISDIRRRRGELVARYTARLEFLRAKLKGAELHEKLLRK
jgi:hypothetical protein